MVGFVLFVLFFIVQQKWQYHDEALWLWRKSQLSWKNATILHYVYVYSVVATFEFRIHINHKGYIIHTLTLYIKNPYINILWKILWYYCFTCTFSLWNTVWSTRKMWFSHKYCNLNISSSGWEICSQHLEEI